MFKNNPVFIIREINWREDESWAVELYASMRAGNGNYIAYVEIADALCRSQFFRKAKIWTRF